MDPTWATAVINPTRCALLASDTWATVSRSYRLDLVRDSPLNHILLAAPHPFAHPNGIDIGHRTRLLADLAPKHAIASHADAKAYLQRKFFGAEPDPSRPLFGFVGRVTAQKGVHLILAAVEPILAHTGGRAQFIVGGMASLGDPYGGGCAAEMRRLRAAHPGAFWADPTAFFTDGVVVNLGCDFCLMPSLFEPGGIVQHEFFVAGTPVVAFRTGGLKDSVVEYSPAAARPAAARPDRVGNGFTFERYDLADFVAALRRALAVFASPDDYSRCRANALRSVMPLSTVSLAWFCELARLRRSLPLPNPTAEAADQEARQAASARLRDMGIEPFDDGMAVPARLGAGFDPSEADDDDDDDRAATRPADADAPAEPQPLGPVTPSLSGQAVLVVVEEADGTLAGGAIAPGTPDDDVVVPVRVVVTAPGVGGSVAPDRRAAIALCGSWDGWGDRLPLLPGPVPGKVCATVGLRPGLYHYKLVVTDAPGSDPRWVVDPSIATASDAGGFENNVASVSVVRRPPGEDEALAREAITAALRLGVAPRMRALLC